MKEFWKNFAIGAGSLVALAVVLVGLVTAVHKTVTYVYRTEIAAAKEQRDLDKYICDKHKGQIYILTAEDGSKERVCLTSEGIVR